MMCLLQSVVLYFYGMCPGSEGSERGYYGPQRLTIVSDETRLGFQKNNILGEQMVLIEQGNNKNLRSG